ncbi:MAG: hypothetical protein ACI95T_001516 [Flavobacteriales bacterium]
MLLSLTAKESTKHLIASFKDSGNFFGKSSSLRAALVAFLYSP